jgi:hypothetical protein
MSPAPLGINDCADEDQQQLTTPKGPTAQTHIIGVVSEKLRRAINGFRPLKSVAAIS